MPKETFFNLNGEKQEKVMRTAVNEFLKHGFEKGNVGDIAKSAGVSKGSMYQYFEDKKELFLFAVRWSMDFLIKKYDKYISPKDMNVFDFFYQNARDMWLQMRDERELVIFIQDVFLGKYKNFADESMEYLMKVSDEHVLQIIRDGKSKGYIRKDIDDNILALFMTGVSFKIKEYIMNKARTAGEEMIDKGFETVEKDISAMLELLKNGMGV